MKLKNSRHETTSFNYKEIKKSIYIISVHTVAHLFISLLSVFHVFNLLQIDLTSKFEEASSNQIILISSGIDKAYPIVQAQNIVTRYGSVVFT